MGNYYGGYDYGVAGSAGGSQAGIYKMTPNGGVVYVDGSQYRDTDYHVKVTLEGLKEQTERLRRAQNDMMDLMAGMTTVVTSPEVVPPPQKEVGRNKSLFWNRALNKRKDKQN